MRSDLLVKLPLSALDCICHPSYWISNFRELYLSTDSKWVTEIERDKGACRSIKKEEN